MSFIDIPKLLLLVPLLGLTEAHSETMEGDLHDLVASLVKRVESLESTVASHTNIIQDLQRTLESTTDTLRRNLQKSECLPRPIEDKNGLRCAFDNIVRFENLTFFNDDAVFNSNVEFDDDADCMPIFNATTRQCSYYNNFTFEEGYIEFRDDVLFTDSVTTTDDVTMQGEGYFTVEDHVKVLFDPSERFVVNTETLFKEDVKVSNSWGSRRDLDEGLVNEGVGDAAESSGEAIDGDSNRGLSDAARPPSLYVEGNCNIGDDLNVGGSSDLGDTDVYSLHVNSYLDVAGTSTLRKVLKAKGGVEAKSKIVLSSGDLSVEYGKLAVKRGGAVITGSTDIVGDLYIDGDWITTGNKIFSGDVTVEGNAYFNKLLTAQKGAVIKRGAVINAPTTGDALVVNGDATVNGVLTAESVEGGDDPGTPPEELTAEAIVDLLNEYSGTSEMIVNQLDGATIPSIKTYDLSVIGPSSEVPGKATVNGANVLTTASDSSVADPAECTCDLAGYVTSEELNGVVDEAVQDAVTMAVEGCTCTSTDNDSTGDGF